MKYIIYLTTNLKNGKIYIGQHKVQNIQTLDEWYLGSGVILKNAISKYGRHNFTRDILYICDNLEDTNILEQEFISIYESNDDKIGYNISVGGRNCGSAIKWIKENDPKRWKILRERFSANGKNSPTKFKNGHKLSPESIQKMKEHLPKKRKPCSEATKLKIGVANRGRTSWAKGKTLGPLPLEVKEKISLAHRGKKLSKEHKEKISKAMKLKYSKV